MDRVFDVFAYDTNCYDSIRMACADGKSIILDVFDGATPVGTVEVTITRPAGYPALRAEIRPLTEPRPDGGAGEPEAPGRNDNEARRARADGRD